MKLYVRLARLSPSTLLIAYCALIPVFAAIFCSLPNQNFYAPYARMEPTAVADQHMVESNIRAAMNESYRGHEDLAADWQIARSDVGDLTMDGSKGLDFTVYFFATRSKANQVIQSTGGPQFTAYLSQQVIVTEHRPGWLRCHLVTFPGVRTMAGRRRSTGTPCFAARSRRFRLT